MQVIVFMHHIFYILQYLTFILFKNFNKNNIYDDFVYMYMIST